MSLMQEFREGDAQRRQEVSALRQEVGALLQGFREAGAQRRQEVAATLEEANARRHQGVAALRQEVWGGVSAAPQPVPEPARHAARRKRRG